MSNIQKKYIITGAPGTGKTSLINLLKETVPCMDEVSRKVIIEEQKNNTNGTPWGNIERFTDLVYQKTIQELDSKNNNSIFTDRGLADNIAYLKFKQKSIPAKFNNFNYIEYYHSTIFILPPWQDIYKEDPQRLQSFKEVKQLHQFLIETYTQLGFTIQVLPKTSIIQRQELLLSKVSIS